MSTPSCPGCGAKFQHDQALMACRQCGLPDEVVERGLQAVKRWRRAKRGTVSTANRRRLTHGRTSGRKAVKRRA